MLGVIFDLVLWYYVYRLAVYVYRCYKYED